MFWTPCDDFVSVSKRLRLALFNNTLQGFWEADDSLAVFYDDFLFEGELPDARGFYFFDSEISPTVTEALFFSPGLSNRPSAPLQGIWCVFDLIHSGLWAELSYSILLKNQRRGFAWNTLFRNYKNIFQNWFYLVTTTHIIALNLVGVGFSCNLVNARILRILVSNTNDLLLYLPAGVTVGIRPGLTEHSDALCFFLYGSDYQLLRLYSKTVRDMVRFNIYEYQGLLYAGEKKIKKVTKQKQK